MGGPVRTGKSRGILEYIHLCALKYPGLRVIFVRETMASLRETALQTYEDDVLGQTDLARDIIGTADRQNRTSYEYPNGSRITLIGMAEINRVLSSEFDLIYIQQVEECDFNDVQKLRTRLTGKILPYPSRMICDCNPGAPTHWILEKARTGWLRYIESTFEENPRWFDCHSLTWNPSGGFEQQGAAEDITGEWTEAGQLLIDDLDMLEGFIKERMRFGRWVAAEGARWPGLDKRTHCFKMADRFPYGLPIGYKKILGMDFGTAAPYSALWLAIDEDRNVFVYREDYEKGLGSVAQISRVIARTGEGEYIEGIYPDPTVFNKPQDPHKLPKVQEQRVKTVGDVYAEEIAGANAERRDRNLPAKFGPVIQIAADPKRRKIGMDLLTTLLTRGNGHPDLWIEEGCVNLWKELCDAVWYQPASGVAQEDIDPKCADHAITGLYYPLIVHYSGAVIEDKPLPSPEEVRQAQLKEHNDQHFRNFERRQGRNASRRI